MTGTRNTKIIQITAPSIPRAFRFERRPEWIDMVQHAARDNRVEGAGVVELFERHAPVKGPLGSFGVDADHVVARGRQTASRASFVATTHLEQATWWLRQL